MNPFTELQRFFERMSEQYDETAEAWSFDEPFGELALGAESMATDLVERDEAYVVAVDLPGFERDDVDIQVTDSTLRIDAERETEVAEEGERYVRRERQEQSAHRSIELPAEVEKDEVTATMENGVLTITLPRAEVEEAHHIEIE
ncbi:hsp20-type chaperone [Salinarchaeum sp. Harcht-Bsk1]|uniref:Hsp20/alpha crystallin family protein n=1 Tax=Salinarchaeum sp. Harcht-Bsk1 TaxID=1333523 RepID=UPI000342421A|nr:Hsp20/alpha crystallin family protein [Salinarchaeum sp. Harcht-Bsk1]AGN01685.1 hsp20-type chaperone [Salinarchaeum sp. Harcht-Bsk1]